MRDEFERLIQLSDKNADLNTTEDGEYFDATIQGQWLGYQMRQPEVDKLIEKIFTLLESIAELERMRGSLPDTKGE